MSEEQQEVPLLTCRDKGGGGALRWKSKPSVVVIPRSDPVAHAEKISCSLGAFVPSHSHIFDHPIHDEDVNISYVCLLPVSVCVVR